MGPMYEAAVSQFKDQGFSVIQDFLTDSDVRDLRNDIGSLVDALDVENTPKSIFHAGENQSKRDQYFLDSGDKIAYFYEEGALDNDGVLVVEKERALNKIGHALHVLNPVFRRITFSQRIKSLMEAFGFVDPCVVQSMYIFKQPKIGGKVVPHIDASYLYVEPIQNLIGIWFALEDATEENGCLWFIPGSHKVTKVDYRFRRSAPGSDELLRHDGKTPEEWNEQDRYIPVPVKKGSAVLIHGLVVHKSAQNTSPTSRHAYTFHVMERKDTKWDDDNWLRLPVGEQFLSIYEEADKQATLPKE